jgi:pimeloyl-ACP methyl ester carboxylesterase
MMRLRWLLVSFLAAATIARAQSAGAWRDPSPHAVRYLTINGARLHLLDWGGRGDLLLLIHGWGSNAHIFDDLAPRLVDRYHVVGLTLRGFGEADTVPSDYSLARYAGDVRAVLDSLHAGRATIAAHSFGGWVLTEFAHEYPKRVQLAVYLDAAFDMRVSDSIVARRPFARPPLVHRKSPSDVMHWLATDFFGTWTPALEAEFRARPRDESLRARQLERVGEEAERARPDWTALRVRALAICAFATPASEFPWLHPTDSGFARASDYVARERRPQQEAECMRFRRSRADRETIELLGHHYVFIMHPAEVARALRDRAPAP